MKLVNCFFLKTMVSGCSLLLEDLILVREETILQQYVHV